MREKSQVLPTGTLPRGLNRAQAAEYIGVSPATFDRLVAEDRMPQATRIYGRRVWDRIKLDEAFASLGDDDPNPWDGPTNDNHPA
jgi:predicted DNA-binding transcriptional regulator AlpA